MTDPITAVREFSRFYTDVLGLLGGALLATPYSLTEARVLYELGQADATGTLELRRRLELDAGYLSRILARFETAGLVAREKSTVDGRRQLLRLTDRGHEVAADLGRRSDDQVAGLLDGTGDPQRQELVRALGTVRTVLGGAAPSGTAPGPVVLREFRPGDLGWVVQRHGRRYAEEYGWDATFEGLVARIVADYAAAPPTARQNAWIAELDGEPVGCVFCTAHDEHTAQLRLLLVEPSARGAGVGTALVDRCLGFARDAGYGDIMLWTNDILGAARRIYERAGFTLEFEGPKPNFGADLTEQIWRRPLTGPADGA